MKKLILSAAVVVGTFGAALADGSCAIGKSAFTSGPMGSTILSCSGDGVCFDTDRNDLKDIRPGDILTVHVDGGKTIDVVVQGSDANFTSAGTVNGVPAYYMVGELEVLDLGE